MSGLFDRYGEPIITRGPNRIFEELKRFVETQYNSRESDMSSQFRSGGSYSTSYDNGYTHVSVQFTGQDLQKVITEDKQVLPGEQVVPFLTRYKDELAEVAYKAVEQAIRGLINEHSVSVVFKIEPAPKKDLSKKSLVTVEEAIS